MALLGPPNAALRNMDMPVPAPSVWAMYEHARVAVGAIQWQGLGLQQLKQAGKESLVQRRASAPAAPEVRGEDPLEKSKAKGSLIHIGSNAFYTVTELGRGSFGTVLEAVTARRDGSGKRRSVAIKWSVQKDDEKWAEAVFEAGVLKQLSEALPDSQETNGHFPRYIAHTAQRPRPAFVNAGCQPGAEARKGFVKIAMSKIEGQPLDKWLYGFDEHRMKKISMSELLDVPHPAGQVAARGFEESAKLATALLSQMAVVFDPVSRIAYHRDISAHNLLVSFGDSGEPIFAVIDFGLAVSSCKWSEEYLTKCLAGTPHYFPFATWMIFTYGHKYVQDHPDPTILRQYLERLDHFAMGVLAIEVFFAAWNGDNPHDDVELTGVVSARYAWRAFWEVAVGFYQKFHGQGVEAFRKTLRSSASISQLQDSVQALHTALREAASLHVCHSVAPLFSVAADLIDPAGSLSWAAIPDLLKAKGSVDVEHDVPKPGRLTRLDSIVTDLPATTVSRPPRSHRRVWSVSGAIDLHRLTDEVSLAC